ITGYASVDTAIEAVKQEHVVSYGTKPINMDSLLPIIKQITERKHAEEKLQFLSSITQQVSDAIIVTDQDFKIKYVNKVTIDVNNLTKLEHPGSLIGERGREVADIIKNKKTHIWYCMARGLHYI
ncbi:hypothetical protein LCGC14_2054610, partial [marine sediment metagenome]